MRKLRLLATLVPLVALAFPAAAQLEKFKDWDKSPEFTLYATEDEQNAWKGVKSDEEAQKFYNLFWGKRHPNYQTTAQNVFRARFDALVAKADELFPLGKPGEKRFRRGALTERGRVLILLGPPKAMASKVQSALAAPGGIGSEEAEGRLLGAGGSGTTILTQFQYEKEQLPEWAGLKSLVLTFTTDQTVLSESVDKPSDVKKVQKKAVAAALVNPKMTEPPVYKTREEHEAEQKAAAEAAAEALKGPVLSAPVRASLEALIGKEPHGDLGTLALAFGDKATQLMIQLAVPGAVVASAAPAAPADPAAPAAAPAPAMKVAVLVKGKDGKDAARREEAAVLQKSKGDFFVDFALRVEPGDYDVAMVLLDASGAESLGPPARDRSGPPGRARSLAAPPGIQRHALRRRQGRRALRLLRTQVRPPGRQQAPEDRRARLRGAALQPRCRPRDEEAEPAAVDLDQAQERLHDRRPPAP
ncbi:MAG: GWxTD domain-containing protein [Holophagales bacterium]|nr:GWxTD domain-containing protein [Holophagales bacterium]